MFCMPKFLKLPFLLLSNHCRIVMTAETVLSAEASCVNHVSPWTHLERSLRLKT